MVQSTALKTAGLLPSEIQGVVADAAAKAIGRTVDVEAFCSLRREAASLSQELAGLNCYQDPFQVMITSNSDLPSALLVPLPSGLQASKLPAAEYFVILH